MRGGEMNQHFRIVVGIRRFFIRGAASKVIERDPGWQIA
jgi:hypothetical protein